MKNTTVTVIDPIGIHARPATIISQSVSKFQSSVTFNMGEKKCNAKSLINIMALGAKKDATIEIVIEGADEQECMDALLQAMRNEKIVA